MSAERAGAPTHGALNREQAQTVLVDYRLCVEPEVQLDEFVDLMEACVVPDPRITRIEAPDVIAQRFHEAYERLAPSFGYKTREASAVPWDDVPEQNKQLMIAVAREVMGNE